MQKSINPKGNAPEAVTSKALDFSNQLNNKETDMTSLHHKPQTKQEFVPDLSFGVIMQVVPGIRGPNMFTMQVKGDSMKSDNGPFSYNDGDTIFMDASRNPQPGDRVVVVDGDGGLMFRELVSHQGKKYLVALNSSVKGFYRDLSADMKVLGVCVAKFSSEVLA